jgi:hypothetical protein
MTWLLLAVRERPEQPDRPSIVPGDEGRAGALS